MSRIFSSDKRGNSGSHRRYLSLGSSHNHTLGDPCTLGCAMISNVFKRQGGNKWCRYEGALDETQACRIFERSESPNDFRWISQAKLEDPISQPYPRRTLSSAKCFAVAPHDVSQNQSDREPGNSLEIWKPSRTMR